MISFSKCVANPWGGAAWAGFPYAKLLSEGAGRPCRNEESNSRNLRQLVIRNVGGIAESRLRWHAGRVAGWQNVTSLGNGALALHLRARAVPLFFLAFGAHDERRVVRGVGGGDAGREVDAGILMLLRVDVAAGVQAGDQIVARRRYVQLDGRV